MGIELEDVNSGCGLAKVTCPNCGANTTHQGNVTAYMRDGEDVETGFKATITPLGGISTERSMKGNPSLRRDGVVIDMWCEQCPHTFELTILQHKGETFIGIR